MARKGSYDFSKGLDTRGAARRTSQEDLDASRTQAAGAPPPPHNPALQAWVKNEIEDRVQRTVIGRYENKGRSPSVTLSPGQFQEFQETGDVAGLLPGYGPHSQGPEDKEYETDF